MNEQIENIITVPLVVCVSFCLALLAVEQAGISIICLMILTVSLGVCGGLGYFLVTRDSKYLFVVLCFCVILTLFMGRLFLRYNNYRQALQVINRAERVTGYVDSFPGEKKGTLSFTFMVTGVREKNSSVYRRVKPFRASVIVKDSKNLSLSRGDCLKIEHPLSVPREKWGTFLYRKYLFYRASYAVIRLNGNRGIQEVKKIEPPLFTRLCKITLWKAREHILLRLKEHLSPGSNAFIQSIFFGLRHNMNKNTLLQFSNSGMMHLLAISGLHVGFLGMIILSLAKLFVPKSTAYLICLVLLFLYIIIITPSASSFRAYLMLASAGTYYILGLRSTGLTHLALAGILLLFINPFYFFDLGFQLSFLATGGILLFGAPIKATLPQGLPAFFKDSISVTCSAFFSLFTLQWRIFGKLPFFALISSVLIVPLFGILFGWYFACSIVIIVTGWQFAAWLLDLSVQLFLSLISGLASIPVFYLPPLPAYLGLSSFFALFCAFYIISPLLRRLLRPVKIRFYFWLNDLELKGNF